MYGYAQSAIQLSFELKFYVLVYKPFASEGVEIQNPILTTLY